MSFLCNQKSKWHLIFTFFIFRGPLAAIRFVGGGGLTGDIHGAGGFTVDSLVAQYLWANQVDRAINLLQTLNWNIAGSMSLSCLQRIANHLFKLPLTPDNEGEIPLSFDIDERNVFEYL